MQTLKWKLEDIFPNVTGSLTATLKGLCQSDTVKQADLRIDYRRFKRFSTADKEEGQALGQETFWRKMIARDLMTIKRLVSSKAAALTNGLTSGSRLADKFWLLSNCRPAGGKWTAANRPVNPRNPTGKACLSWLCPWCWMRRFDDMRLIVAQPYEAAVKLHDGRITKGLGLAEAVNVTSFTLWASGGPEAVAKVQRPETLDGLLDLATDAVAHKYVPAGAVLDQLKTPEFSRALRIMCPVFVKGDNENACGWRVTYVHDTAFEAGDPANFVLNTVHGRCEVSRQSGLTHAEALHVADPFPIDLLHTETSANMIFELLQTLDSRRHYTCKEFKRIQPCAVVDFSI